MKSSIFSPKFFYITDEALELIDENILKVDNEFEVKQIVKNIKSVINCKENIEQEIKEDMNNILIKTIPNKITEKIYYGWTCPVCLKISSPAMPICYFCNQELFKNIEIEQYIPYWNDLLENN